MLRTSATARVSSLPLRFSRVFVKYLAFHGPNTTVRGVFTGGRKLSTVDAYTYVSIDANDNHKTLFSLKVASGHRAKSDDLGLGQPNGR